MTRSTPTVRENTLSFYEEDQVISIVVGSGRWFEWLREETSTIFSFQSLHGSSYTARRERVGNSRGGWYWKAYRKHQGTLYRAYLGKPEDLTVARLAEIAVTLAGRIQGEVGIPQDLSSAEPQPSHQRHYEGSMPLLLETKLHPPQLLVLLVERTRLLSRLDNSLGYKLTLLQAPAGFGKTTLVNQWFAARRSTPTFPALAWVSLDGSDNDPLSFWRYVMRACQMLLGKEARALNKGLALLSAANRSLFEQPPIEMALTHMLNDLTELSSGGLLVLDDYHAITEPRIHETLTFFIDHLPPTVHVLLLSRSEPPLSLLRWRARGVLYDLHVADLRFSLEEEETFLSQALPVSISEAALNQLDTTLEGWAAGLRLISLTLAGGRTANAVEQALLSLGERTTGSQAAEGLTTPHRSLLDYFVLEILETQSEPLQRFLLQTSMLSRLCAPLCDEVTGRHDSAEMLEAIERAGLFLEALEGPGGWYRYHTLFAEAMSREANRRQDKETRRALALRASSWYERERLLMETVEMAWLARDVERVAKLIELSFEIEFYEPRTMLRWLEHIPEAVLREHPMLCLIFATELCFPVELRFSQKALSASAVAPLSETQGARVEALLQMAEESWRKAGNFAWIGTIWSHRALISLVYGEPISHVIDYSKKALAYLPQGDEPDLRLRMYRSSCWLFDGIDKLRAGQIADARQTLLGAQEDNISPGNRYLALDIHLTLGKCYALQGELRRAGDYLRQSLAEARELRDNEMVADILLELAWLAFEWNDLRGAEQQAREAQDIVLHQCPWATTLSDGAILQLALLQHVQGETVVALAQLTKLLEKPQKAWAPGGFWFLPRVRDWHARLRIAVGDGSLEQEALPLLSQSDESASITEYLEEQVSRGRLLLARGDATDALQQFAHILPSAQEHLHQYVALQIQLQLALAHATCKQDQQAFYWLRQTLSQAMHAGYIRLFLNEGKPLTRLLRLLLPAIEDKALRAYVQTILRAETQVYEQGSTPQNTSNSSGSLLEPLSLQEQRVLRLLAAGWSNQDIARELIVSVNTVKYHVKHLYQKLGVNNRLQASEAARYLKLDESL
ncbi:hypothetical protein KSC_102600 [Ktedonobacter sp. SOSP1-52]|uniref:LuxR C-terminal-related transcriptional regulator n=1 Tax=Ktedonobacter sp. SOSP1-52 TaxID=2778366 RepID=UPI001A1FA913|nr:LuxR C-terminal-related transcriptional regulator [Ktedonobacter sp. SOSP1-52]GHO71368.1 hypothetical protein KSC_102600 [Ktedonobacter sp. SOSP1-52]